LCKEVRPDGDAAVFLEGEDSGESIANACGDWHVCLEYMKLMKGSSTGSWTVFLALVMLKGFIEHHT
jgi:hypothetical protein